MTKRPAPLPTPLPCQTFFACVDDTEPPLGYVGDWPVRGQIYSGRVLLHHLTKTARVYLDGFWTQYPYSGLPLRRFEAVWRVWLN